MSRLRWSLRQQLRKVFRRGSISHLADRYPEYNIGPGSYGDLKVFHWGEGATLSVGSYVSIAQGVSVFLGGEHRPDWVTTYPFNVLWPEGRGIAGHPRTKGDVRIGNDVWVGAGATIMSGVTVGDGAVIGARALVSRDVPPYGIVVGNPAQLIKRRFDDPTIERLLELKWWDWPPHVLQRAIPRLLSSDLEEFLRLAGEGAFGNTIP